MVQELETLHDSARTRVIRALDSDGQAVVLKRLRSAWPTPEALARLRREHDLLVLLEGNGAPQAVRVDHDPPQLVTRDTHGVSLLDWLASVAPPTAMALDVALGLAKAVAAVHARGVLHRDINPANIVLDPRSREVWLIDFDLASPVAHHSASARPAGPLEGTPAYLAPEQTGRTNRAIDARTDLYGLGITLYELFSGRVPFESDDVLGYAHAHLALEPPPLPGSIPAPVRALVSTLIAKRPEDRYQSAAGVVLDLQRIQGGETALVGRTVSERPSLPQDLVGREHELRALTDALATAQAGGRAIALVHGEAGIGKTTLVRELYPPVTLVGGRILEGKFDQYTRDLPYAALSQVLTALVADALSESTSELERWRTRLLEATAPNTALLVELAPQLEVLLGSQPAAVELAPTEAQARLQETVRRAIRAIALPQSPLVLFLDDLQWADLPSLKVLEALLRDPELRHLLLVAAWRDTEVGEGHALQPALASLTSTDAKVARLALGPLKPDDVTQLLASALQRDDVEPLARRLWDKTSGNPFFLRRIVQEAGGAIHYDLAALRWVWDDDGIDRLAVAENVVALLKAELSRLSGDARTALSAAALLGDPFDLGGLNTATGLGEAELAPAVDSAIQRRFVRPLDHDYWAGGNRAARFRFAFVHDRVQQAARDLLSDDERARLHLAVARGMAPDASDDDLFRVAEHYRAAADLVAEPTERDALVRLLARAAERALRCAAYLPAHRFAETALRAAGSEGPEPALAVHLRRMAARAAWLVGNTDLMQAHVDALHGMATGLPDRLRADEIRIHAMIAHGDLHAALDTAVEGLAAAGVALPRKPRGSDVHAAVGALLPRAASTPVEGLPEVGDDPLETARRRILVRIASAAYVAEPNLLPLIAIELVDRTLTSGASKESAYGYGVFGLVLSAGWLLDHSAQQGRNALALLDRFPDRVIEGTVRHLVNHFVRVWNEPMRRIYDETGAVYRSLMDVGDLEYAGWVLHMRVIHGFFSGVPLGDLDTEIEHAVAVMKLHDMQAAMACTLQFQQLVKGLRGDSDDPAHLVGPEYDEAQALEALTAIDFRAAVCALSLCMLSARTFCNAPDAAEAAATALAFADGAVALFYQVPLRVYAAIARLDAGEPPEAVLALRDPVAACAAHNPHNGAHLLALFDAEIARAGGDLAAAITQYDRAIAGAQRAGFLHDQALANERAASMHEARGNHRIATAYLRDARYAWSRWGASAKVQALDERYPDLAAPEPEASDRTLKSQRALPSARLDLMSLLKASQAISEETQLDALLTRAMRILNENVGARRGVLLLARRGELRLEAEARTGGEVTLHDGAAPTGVPLPLVRRVWRTGQAEVQESPAVLCAPVTHQGRNLGVLVFENDLSGAFTGDRLQILEVLAPQLAISIRNVRLQEAQSRFVPRQFIRSLDRADIVDVDVGDHKLTEVTVFFSDIWGFTPIVERLTAKEALGFINRYLSYAEPAITGNGGFIDTYLGDGIMALFDGATNASNAVAASIAFHHALDRFNEERRRGGLTQVRTGVGLNTGTVTMGTIGGQRSLKCGVVGDPVNLASRVEGLTRRTATRLLISDNTHERLRPGFQVRRAGKVMVKGRDTPLTVYEVLDAERPEVRAARLATRDAYEAALDAWFACRVDDAIDGLEQVLAQTPDDPQPRRFLEMAHALKASGIPEDWDGIERLTAKK
ncbi:MAG: AAA family ATPase [Alphaproteobacteria bacterium]|nr:AAA family ATPase [Alphaproteobacteria bacterium]